MWPRNCVIFVVTGALFSVVGSVESIVSILSIGYPYILPILEDHNLSPGTAFLILSAFGLVPIVFIRSDSHVMCHIPWYVCGVIHAVPCWLSGAGQIVVRNLPVFI